MNMTKGAEIELVSTKRPSKAVKQKAIEKKINSSTPDSGDLTET